jgi:hypothetical protein
MGFLFSRNNGALGELNRIENDSFNEQGGAEFISLVHSVLFFTVIRRERHEVP